VDRGVALAVAVEGTDLPGRSCAPADAGRGYTDVHVGLCDRSFKGPPVVVPKRPWGVGGVVSGDAPSARWDVEILVRDGGGDGLDFGGRYVRGGRGDRHLGLAWGELTGGETFILFRAAKLKLDTLDPSLIDDALAPKGRLVVQLALTDTKGNPRCATVNAPDLVWTVERR
jgi:hypothetical protein